MNIQSDLYLLRYAILEMDFWTLINWAVLVVISVVLWQALRGQNKRYKELVGEGEQYSEERQALFRLAQSRGSVLLLLWLVLVMLLMAVDVSKQINRSRNYLQVHDEVAINVKAQNPFIVDEVVADEAMSDAMMPSSEPDYSQPNDSLAKIKSSYEDAFVSLMILQKCELAGEAEQNALYAALLGELSPSDDKAQIAKGVMSAANGSYHSLYDGVKCDGATIKNTQTNFALFMKQVQN